MVADLDRTLCRMHKGPDLEVGGAVAQLFAVSMEVIVRFQDYQRWPFKAFTLCAKFSPDGLSAARMHFLNLPDAELDVGFSLQLQRLALAQGDQVAALRNLMSAPVQEALALCFESSAASS